MELNPIHINHLYDRACFGVPFDVYKRFEASESQTVVRRLFQNAYVAKDLSIFGPSPNKMLAQKVRSGELKRQEVRKMMREMIDESRTKIRNLNCAWLAQMQSDQSAGLEKLVYFWHDHFGVRVNNGYQAETHNNTLRRFALGDYKNLLTAVAKDPAMLAFLNNQQNVKANPNENFARELLELFTIGRGNYSEKDVKEAARAFTGWRVNRRTGTFSFDKRNHDNGRKVFMGQSGDFDGDDIIRIILENPNTAEFLAAKFYAFYVSDVPNQDHISVLAKYYYQKDYNTQALLEYMFVQPWFYEGKQIQSRIKSPLELINNFHSQLGLSFNNPTGWLLLQRNFSQVMFFPPSVAGWPKGKEWIDSSSLVNRMKLPSVLLGMDQFIQEESPEVDAADPFKDVNRKEVMRTAELGLWAYDLSEVSEEDNVIKVEEYLFNKRLPQDIHDSILEGYKQQTIAKRKQWLFVTLCSLPEYQMA